MEEATRIPESRIIKPGMLVVQLPGCYTSGVHMGSRKSQTDVAILHTQQGSTCPRMNTTTFAGRMLAGNPSTPALLQQIKLL
jgi:hypothetical protein